MLDFFFFLSLRSVGSVFQICILFDFIDLYHTIYLGLPFLALVKLRKLTRVWMTPAIKCHRNIALTGSPAIHCIFTFRPRD